MHTINLNHIDKGGKRHWFKLVPQRSKLNSINMNSNPTLAKIHEFNTRQSEQVQHAKTTSKPNQNGENNGSTSIFHKQGSSSN